MYDYLNGQKSPQTIRKWTKREIDDDTYIYRPRIKRLIHTDFYLNEEDCLNHWWYKSDMHFGDDRLPPYKQKFGEYLSSIEMSGVDLFGSLAVLDAKLKLMELDNE